METLASNGILTGVTMMPVLPFIEDTEENIAAIIARVLRSSMLEVLRSDYTKLARAKGIKAGLIRPITLFPFPEEILLKSSGKLKGILAVELSSGQMIEDVRLALEGQGKVHFYGRPGGVVPTPVELYRLVSRHYYQSARSKKQ